MTDNARVLIYVQHLLGIGHLKRTALIAKALSEAGLDATVASGGFPVDNLNIGRARLVPAAAGAQRGCAVQRLAGRDGAAVERCLEGAAPGPIAGPVR